MPQAKGKVEYWTLGTPLTEVSYLSSFHAASYGTKCDTNIFNRLNDRWTTTPHTRIPGLYMAGSDAFLPAVCGAMVSNDTRFASIHVCAPYQRIFLVMFQYGGLLGASAILGYSGSARMVFAFLSEFATALQVNVRTAVAVCYSLIGC